MLTGSGLTGTARAAAVGAAAEGEWHAAPPPGDSRPASLVSRSGSSCCANNSLLPSLLRNTTARR
jgi:hypothetical protein